MPSFSSPEEFFNAVGNMGFVFENMHYTIDFGNLKEATPGWSTWSKSEYQGYMASFACEDPSLQARLIYVCVKVCLSACLYIIDAK